MRILIFGTILALLSACGDPLVMLPGGTLSGTEMAAPEQWAQVPDTVQLETNPGDPYSVNVWAAGVGSNLYVATGEEGSSWSEYMDADPKVRIRMGDSIYRLNATRVTDIAELSAVGAAYITKYDMDPDEDWSATSIVYRLDRRP
ncbi:hypothetical protein EYC98_17140 [Halieaceae bacterium IMCC14734]|uniref:DUF2255 family protein n=1 Tax=Candidatus Litorirhabdus singularis TaxID=2518993 RepID=A0ABT3TLJ7_9GAMM|nr:hypothetical protein [Candidatus Litorirhabdus singularis]MCX2982591.1 hypothetical protein [Candidatus Litorirhabdus singularis]